MVLPEGPEEMDTSLLRSFRRKWIRHSYVLSEEMNVTFTFFPLR